MERDPQLPKFYSRHIIGLMLQVCIVFSKTTILESRKIGEHKQLLGVGHAPLS